MSAAEATKAADVVNILCPTKCRATSIDKEIKPNLKPGNILMCSHGFNIHFGQVEAAGRASMHCWSRRRGRATWCAANSWRAAACPA